MRRVRGWWYLFGCLVVSLGFSQCTLRWQDMRGFPCDNDAQCGPSLSCTDRICGGLLREPDVDAADEEPGSEANSPDEVTPDTPLKVPPLSTHARWVRAAGGEFDVRNQRSIILPVGKDALYLVGAYRFFRGATPPQSDKGQTYGMITKLSASGALQWTETITGDTPDVRLHDIAAAPDNTLVVAGMFYGTATFGSLVRKSRGDGDAFVAKYDPTQRKFLWVSTWGSTGYDEGWKVQVNQKGEVFVSGTIRGTSHIFSADGKTNQPLPNKWQVAKGSTGAFLLKLTSQGGYVWHHLWGSHTSYARAFVFLDIRSTSHIYTLVSYNDVLFNAEDQEILNGNGAQETGLLRIETKTGQLTKAISVGGNKKTALIHLTQDPMSGDLLLAGSYEGTWTYTTSNGTRKSLQAIGPSDSVLVRMAQDGKIKWIRRFGGTQSSSFEHAIVAPDGAIFGVGAIRGAAHFDRVPLQGLGKGDDPNGFIAKFAGRDGETLAAWIVQGPFSNFNSIKAGPSGFYLSGIFRGKVDFGARSTSPLYAVGGNDNFVLHFVP